MNLPNLITVVRMLSAPVIITLVLSHNLGWALVLFCVAAGSDGLDGYLARRLGSGTTLGSILDPLADKVLLVSVYFVLGYTGYIPLWLVIIVIFRDIFILGGALLFFLFESPVTVRPLLVSKINTAFQFLYIVIILYAALEHWPSSEYILLICEILVGSTTLLSGLEYARIWFRRMMDYVD